MGNVLNCSRNFSEDLETRGVQDLFKPSTTRPAAAALANKPQPPVLAVSSAPIFNLQQQVHQQESTLAPLSSPPVPPSANQLDSDWLLLQNFFKSVQDNDTQLYKETLPRVMLNFARLLRTHHEMWLQLPFSVILDILKSEILHCDEFTLYKAVKAWASKNEINSTKQLDQLYKWIRFTTILPDQLVLIERDKGIANYILEAYRVHACQGSLKKNSRILGDSLCFHAAPIAQISFLEDNKQLLVKSQRKQHVTIMATTGFSEYVVNNNG